MTITFICGSIEQGKDGVGDYTRRLAAELIRQDHKASILAINDKCAKTISQEVQYDLDTSIPTYRLPKALVLKAKKQLAEAFIKESNPEWLSLQYVPFSFNDKGVPLAWRKVFKKIGKGRKWHILFHELWVNKRERKDIKTSILKYLQQRAIINLIATLTPLNLQTQSKIHKVELRDLNIHVSILPLFSNIPICASRVRKNEEFLTFVSFGRIRLCHEIEAFISELSLLSQKSNRIPKILIVGRSGSLKEQWIQIGKQYSVAVKILEDLSVEEVSMHLQSADVGIASLPIDLIDKSSAAATLLSHNLPVICLNTKHDDHQHITNEGIFEYKKGNLDTILNSIPENIEGHFLTDVAMQFQADLLGYKVSMK